MSQETWMSPRELCFIIILRFQAEPSWPHSLFFLQRPGSDWKFRNYALATVIISPEILVFFGGRLQGKLLVLCKYLCFYLHHFSSVKNNFTFHFWKNSSKSLSSLGVVPLFLKFCLVLVILCQLHIPSWWVFQDYPHMYIMKKLLVYAKLSAQVPGHS